MENVAGLWFGMGRSAQHFLCGLDWTVSYELDRLDRGCTRHTAEDSQDAGG
jgi:hypothetical protein